MRSFVRAALIYLIPLLVFTETLAQQPDALVRAFLYTLAPSGAQIKFDAVETAGAGIDVRDIVAHSESAAGEEIILTAGRLQLQGLRELGSGQFHVDELRAENVRVDGSPPAGGAVAGFRIESITASGIAGTRINSLAVSGVSMSAVSGGAEYALGLKSAALRDVDAGFLNKLATRGNIAPKSGRPDDALISALLNTKTYASLDAQGLIVRKDAMELLSIAELGNEPDGVYVPFPASGRVFARQVKLNLRDPMTGALRQRLDQDDLVFDYTSAHRVTAPGKHRWDVKLKLPPDGELVSICTVDNLNGFSPALIRQAQAASANSAVLRRCETGFTGTEFVNRWLARDGAKDGFTAEQARGKYLALALYVPFDPKLSGDPLALEFASAAQIFLSQPSRLNILLEPEGGLKYPEGLMTLSLLFQGTPEQKQQAAKRLGLSISAKPFKSNSP